MTAADLHYDLHHVRFDNGFELVVAPDHDAPGVAINLWVEVGSADEVAGKTGFAHLFEHLMFQGSGAVASGEHMAAIEALGGTVNATTSSDRTNYFETVPPGALDLALWLEADRFSSLAITDANFKAQRDVVKEEKRQRYDNQPYGDLLELLTAQHFSPEHPYGHLTIGSMPDLDAASLDDVAGFFDAWYPAGNVRLVLAGPVTPDDGAALAERHFGALPARPKSVRSPMPSTADRAPRTTVVTRPVPHSLTYLSWATAPAADAATPALDVALAVLADGHASRLHRTLVKQRRSGREIHAATLTHRSSASIATILGRPAEDVDVEVLTDAIVEEVARFADEGPTDEELRRALAGYERDWLWGLAATTGRADAINEQWLIFGDPAGVNSHLADVLALTADDVRVAARRWLTPDAAARLHYVAEAAR